MMKTGPKCCNVLGLTEVFEYLSFIMETLNSTLAFHALMTMQMNEMNGAPNQK